MSQPETFFQSRLRPGARLVSSRSGHYRGLSFSFAMEYGAHDCIGPRLNFVERPRKSDIVNRKFVAFLSRLRRTAVELLRTFARCCEPFPVKKLILQRYARNHK
jgi:hypothetical protein